MSEFIAGYMQIGEITLGENVRLPNLLDLPSLQRSVEANGIEQPLQVWNPRKGVTELLCGYRRLAVCHNIEPERLAELHPQGIPVLIWKDLTPEEALKKKLDHSGTKPLTHPFELIMSATMMYNNGSTEAEVANHLMPLIQAIDPIAPDKRAQIEALEKAVEETKGTAGNKAAKQSLYTRIAEMYRGRCQGLHDVARCPKIVHAALRFNACGERMQGFETEEFPSSLTLKQRSALWKAHSEDMSKLDEKGMPKYSKSLTGPTFNALWAEIVRKDAEPKNETVRDKAMSAKALLEECKNGDWESEGMYKISQYHAGKLIGKDTLQKLDKEYKALDLVKEYDASLFEAVINSATDILEMKKAEQTEEKTEVEG